MAQAQLHKRHLLESPPPLDAAGIGTTDTTKGHANDSHEIVVAPCPPMFQYPELGDRPDGFRLLRFRPSADDRDLACDLVSTSVGEWEGRYIAGSYAWGPPTPLRAIHVNEQRLEVRDNLYWFLKSLSGNVCEPGSTYVWIDLICINQSSVAERNHQVKLMSLIYSAASQVIGWLGLANDDTEWYTRCLRDQDKNPFAESAFNFHGAMLWDASAEFILTEDKFNRTVCSVADLPYWKRLWIVQELVLAKSILLLWGKYKVRWADFMWHVCALDSMGRYMVEQRDGIPTQLIPDVVYVAPIRHDLKGLLEIQRCRTARSYSPLPLDYLIHWTQKKRCSDLHDKVYAVLGMHQQHDDPDSKVTVDYSCTIRTLFLRVSTAVTLSDDLMFLCTLVKSLGISTDVLATPQISETHAIRFHPSTASQVVAVRRGQANEVGDIVAARHFSCSDYDQETRSVARFTEPEARKYGDPQLDPISEMLNRHEQGPYFKCLKVGPFQSYNHVVQPGDFIYHLGHSLYLIVHITFDNGSETDEDEMDTSSVQLLDFAIGLTRMQDYALEWSDEDKRNKLRTDYLMTICGSLRIRWDGEAHKYRLECDVAALASMVHWLEKEAGYMTV